MSYFENENLPERISLACFFYRSRIPTKRKETRFLAEFFEIASSCVALRFMRGYKVREFSLN